MNRAYQLRQPVKLGGAYDLVCQQDVSDAAAHHGLCLVQLLAANARLEGRRGA